MHPILANHFERELRHARGMRADFARDHEAAGKSLGVVGEACDDPYVERLVESFAYLNARVQAELSGSFPAFAQGVLESLCPACLGPVPSATIAEIGVDPTLAADGFLLPAGRLMHSRQRPGETACTWRVARDVHLWPISISDAKYVAARDLATLALPDQLRISDDTGQAVPAAAAVQVTLTSAGPPLRELAEAGFDDWSLFLHGTDDPAGARRLHENLLRHAGSILAVGGSGRTRRSAVAHRAVVRDGFDASESMLPPGPRLSEPHRLVLEYLMLPERFRFVKLRGLRRLIRNVAAPDATDVTLALLLSAEDDQLENAINADSLRPHCTPIVNLFRRETDRQKVEGRTEDIPVIVDQTRAHSYEVWSVESVTGYTDSKDKPATERYTPAFASDADAAATRSGGVFTTRRIERNPTVDERRDGRERSGYVGSETLITLSDHEGDAPSPKQVSATVWCTNRDLPLTVSLTGGHGELELLRGEPVAFVRGIAGNPTPPRAGPATFAANPGAEASAAWQLVNALAINHLPLGGDGTAAAPALAMLLRILGGENGRRAGLAIHATRSRPITRRLLRDQGVGFVRGVGVDLVLDDRSDPRGGLVLLGAVLERVLTRAAAINAFVETTLTSHRTGHIVRWQPQPGRRHLL